MSDAKHRNALAKDLEELASILSGDGVCPDPGPLYAASSMCRKAKHAGCWHYNVAGLILHVGDNVKCIPQQITTFSCRLDIEVGGNCAHKHTNSDPLRWLTAQIELKAPSAKPAMPPFVQTWHFDRHPGDCAAPKPSHPRYHFSFGGRAFEGHLVSFGKTLIDGLLLLDSPRLTHPPFDGVLAIDFLLSNFAGARWRVLCSNPNYCRIIRQAQDRLWAPYARALHAHWAKDVPAKAIWPITEIWPHVMQSA